MAYIDAYTLKDGTKRYRARTRAGGRGSKMVSGKATDRKTWANDKADDLEKLRVSGKLDVKSQDTKIKEMYKDYVSDCETQILRKEMSPKTLRFMQDNLKFFGEIYNEFRVSDFSPGIMEKYEKILEGEKKDKRDGSTAIRFSTNGVHVKLRAARTFLNWGHKEKYFITSPALNMKIEEDVPVGRALTDEEIFRIFDIGCRYNKELFDIMMVLVYTGLREGEIVKIDKEHIIEGHIYIERRNKTKNKIPKMIPILPPVEYVFARIQKGLIFPGWSEGRLYRAFSRAKKRAGIVGRLRVHDMRHTCASYLLRKGYLTLEDVQKLFGHTDYRITQKFYSHYETFHLKEKLKNVRFPTPKPHGAPDGAPILQVA